MMSSSIIPDLQSLDVHVAPLDIYATMAQDRWAPTAQHLPFDAD